MTIKEAQYLVEVKVMAEKMDCALIPESTTEYNTCFTFYYQSKSYLKSKSIGDMLVGHGPILVDKRTGKVFETGSAYPEEQYVNAFEACGDPFASPTKNVAVQGWRPGAEKVAATKFIKKVSALSLGSAKEIIDNALDDKLTIFTVTPEYDALDVVKQLNNYGFRCRQLWSNEC